MNMILLNEPLTGQEAYRLGLVSKRVEPGKALSGALEIAEKLASQSASTLMVAKEAICRGELHNLSCVFDYSQTVSGRIAA
jgi:enoyl-CoA hydratase